MPGTPLSPEVMLHQALAEIEDTKGVVLIVYKKDETVNAGWSDMLLSEVCMASAVLQHDINEALR